MPSLRLSVEDSRDIASYLITLKHPDAQLRRRPISWTIPSSRTRASPWCSSTAARDAMKSPASKTKAASAPSSPTKAASPSSASISRCSPKTPSAALSPTARSRRAARGTTSRASSNTSWPIPAVYDTGKYKPNPLDRLRMPKPNVNGDGYRRHRHHAAGQHRSFAAARLHVQALRRARLHPEGLVDRHQVQLHGLPSDRYRPEVRADGPAHVSGRRQDQSAARAHQRRRARQSRLAEEFPGQSGAQHHGHRIATACAATCRSACPRSSSPTTRFARWCFSSKPSRIRPSLSFRRSSSRSPPRKREWLARSSPAPPRLA